MGDRFGRADNSSEIKGDMLCEVRKTGSLGAPKSCRPWCGLPLDKAMVIGNGCIQRPKGKTVDGVLRVWCATECRADFLASHEKAIRGEE